MTILKTTNHDNFLSKQTTNHIKGVLVCMVIISHLSGRVQLFSNSIFGTIFGACGYLAVSMFFFLSGYGLYEQYRKNPEPYIRRFPGKKILPYYAMCCAVIVIYLVRDLLFGSVSWSQLAKSFFVGDTIVDNGWYLQAQLALYIIFFLSFRLLKHKGVWLVAALLILYCAICAAAGMNEFWYEAVLCFAFGIVVSKNKECIVGILQGKLRTALWLAGVFAAFAVTLLMGNKAILPENARIVVKMISTVCFTSVVVLALSLINTENPVTAFLGKYSFEMYVLQGLFLWGYRPVIQNDWLYILAVSGSTFITALAAKPVFSMLGRAVVVDTDRPAETGQVR